MRRHDQSTASGRDRAGTIKAVAIVSSGNFLEMYDFMVFGYYATAIGAAFFPAGDEFASLMASLMTFGAGFLMRPLGGLLLGAYMDRHGRRAGLLATLALMGVGMLIVACLPGYATLGLAAPLIVLFGRLLQGLSAGVEVGGVSVYLAEIASPGRRGFYVSWQSASQQLSVIFTAAIGLLLTVMLSRDAMMAWGWRVPMVLGCLLLPFVFWIRGSLAETETFLSRRRRPGFGEILRSVAINWRIIALGTSLATMTTVSFYLITAYTPTFGSVVLRLAPERALLVTLCIGTSNFILLPVMGRLSDAVGRTPLLVVAASLALVTGYPALSWLVSSPSFGHLLAVELWLSLVYACYNGAMIVYLTEIMPPDVRTAGFSLAYSLATAIFGGFTPAVCTYLIHVTNNRAMPGLWLSCAALVGLGSALLLALRPPSQREAPVPPDPAYHQVPESGEPVASSAPSPAA